ncbi:MAG TPA: hypothetical protein VFX19_05510 [Dehalococcoidia bacterium]|nr:hypothetical protein [Dehalococcoidia bacterium]
MRIAFVTIPRFACAVEAQRDPSLARIPLIVGDADEPRRVFDCSEAAAAAGIWPGMSIRNALAASPDAAVLGPDPVLYRNRWHTALEALDSISPEIEDNGLGQAYVNVEGLGPNYRNDEALAAHIVSVIREACGLEARVGLGRSKFLAFAAATRAAPGRGLVVPAGGEGAFLAPLSVELLPLDPEIAHRLQTFGIETLGGVAPLSLPELQSQFGFEGRRLWQLAHGVDDEPLRPRPRDETLAAGLSFDTPVGGIEAMIAAARQLLSRLRLPLKGRAARELLLEAELITGRGWERRLVFREAVSEDQRLVFVLRSALTNFPPPTAIKSLGLRLSGLSGETGKQLILGERGRLQRQVEECIRQLKARYGYSPIYRCVDVEPWSVIPEEQQILVESDV